MVADKPKGLCKFGEDCNFAFNQLEIDVWTEERNGRLDRKRLFETAALQMDPINNIKHLLQDHSGAYTFLCQVGALALGSPVPSAIDCHPLILTCCDKA